MAKEQLIIELIAESKNAVKNLKNYTDAAKKSSERVGKLTKLIKGYFGEITAGVLIARKLIKVVGDLTKAYGLQELSVVNLESALKATGIYTPELSSDMQDLAKSLQEVTTSGDEATLEAAALLQSLGNLNAEGLKTTIPLILDFAAGMKIDLNTAASLVGKTLGSTTNALSRYGIVLDATADQQTKIAQLQESINEKFGGRAKDIANTYTGQVTQLKNEYGDLKELLGFFISQSLEPLIPAMKNILDTTSIWLQSKKDLKEAYTLLGKVAVEELDKISKAETEAAIKSIFVEIEKIEPLIKAFSENVSGLNLEQKKQLTVYLSLKTELKKYLASLAMEVDMTDELREKYGMKKKVIKEVRTEYKLLTAGMEAYNEVITETVGIFTELEKGTFDAFHAAEIYNYETKTKTIPVARNEAESLMQIVGAMQMMGDESVDLGIAMVLMVEVISAALQQNLLAILIAIGKAIVKLFNKARQEMKEISQELIAEWKTWLGTIRATLDQGFVTGMQDAIRAFIDGGSLEDMKAAITENIKDGIINAFIQAAIQKAIIEGAVGDMINNLASSIAAGGKAFGKTTEEWIADIRAAMPGIIAIAENIAEAAPALVSGFQSGGQVQHLQSGGFGDRVPAMLEPGEVVIPKHTVQKNAASIGAMRGGEGGNVTNLVLDGKVLARWIWNGSQNRNVTISAKAVL